jgi:hypothetical protein
MASMFSPSSVFKRSPAAPGLIVAVCTLAPFLFKAFTVDDGFFLLLADHALRDPWHPLAIDLNWHGQEGRVSEANGPLIPWLLTPSAWLGAEWPGHLIWFALLCAGILATVRLALRLGASESAARWSGLLVATTPAVLAMASTCMPDVPAMAFAVIGVERTVAWKERRTVGRLLAAGLFLALAVLSRSHLILLLGVALLLGRDLRPALCAVALILGIILVTRDPHAGAPSALGTLFSLHNPIGNAVAFLSNWALTTPFVLGWIWIHRLWRTWPLWLLSTGLVAWGIHFTGFSNQLWIAPLVGWAPSALGHALVRAWRSREPTEIALGLWLLVALPMLLYHHLPTKYLVPSIPAAAILLGRERIGRGLGLTLLGAGWVLSLMVIRTDARFAALGRRVANEWIPGHGRVWYAGTWGFQWYASHAGARRLESGGPLPAAGDFLIVDLETDWLRAADWVERKQLVAVMRDNAPGGRVMSRAAGVGFYSNGHGYLPWTYSRVVPLHQYQLWRVE